MAEKDTVKDAGKTSTTKRKVRGLFATYTGLDGHLRDARRGEVIEVHQDDLARFDRVDGLDEALTVRDETTDPDTRVKE